MSYRILPALAAAAALFAWLHAAPAMADAAHNVLDFGQAEEPITFDPAQSNSGNDTPELTVMYDELVGVDPGTLELRPELATSWSWSDDKRDLTFNLRHGVKFQDGTDFDAEAVKVSLEHSIANKRITEMAMIQSIEVKDPYIVVLHLTQPYSVMPAVLADRPGMIISPTALKKYGADFGNHPVGTGPFQFVSWEPGKSVVVKRFDGYWNKDKIKLDGVVFHIIGNPTSLVAALQAGQLDFASNLDAVNLPVLKKNAKLVVKTEPTLGWGVLEFNTGLAPVDDMWVRRAMNMAIDRQALANAVYGPAVHTTGAELPVPRDYWTSTPALADAYKYDPAGAKKLLAEHGFPNGVKVLTCGGATGGMVPAPMALSIVAEQMKPAGITLDIQTPATINACFQLYTGTRTLPALVVWWSGAVDPYQTYFRLFGAQGFYNISHRAYPGVDDLLDQVLRTTDRTQLKALYDKLNQAWIDDAPTVPLYYFVYVVATGKNVRGEGPDVLIRRDVRYFSFAK